MPRLLKLISRYSNVYLFYNYEKEIQNWDASVLNKTNIAKRVWQIKGALTQKRWALLLFFEKVKILKNKKEVISKNFVRSINLSVFWNVWYVLLQFQIRLEILLKFFFSSWQPDGEDWRKKWHQCAGALKF